MSKTKEPMSSNKTRNNMVTPATQSHTIQFEGKSKIGFDPEKE